MTDQDLKGDLLFSFGPFVLDPARRVLRKGGDVVPLRPKTFDLLFTFVEHRGELLEKDRLIKLVWPDNIVEENNLARHVSTLRRVLERAGAEEYIVTIPLRGYRFVAPIELVDTSRGHAVAGTQKPIAPPPTENGIVPVSGRSTTLTWIGLVTALVVITSFAGTQARLPRLGERGGMTHRKLWQLTFTPGVQDEPAWSPNGEWIAYTSDRNGNADVWIQPVGQENPRRVTSSSANDWQPAWSPDGRYIAFRSERDGGGLFIVQPDGAGERKISDFGYKPRWSPDSSRMLFYGPLKTSAARWAELFEVSMDGGAPVPVLGKLVAQFQWFHAAWHPGDGRISILGARRGGATELVTARDDGQGIVRSEVSPEVAARLRDANVTFGEFRWSPAGNALFLEGVSEGVRNIWRVAVDPGTLAWNSTVERLTTGAELDTNINLSSDGKRIAFSLRKENTRLWAFPFDAADSRITGPGEPFTAEGADAPYHVSPDGGRVVYRAVRHGQQELWQRTLANGQDRLLLTGASISAPRFSPDGLRLVYRRDDGSDSGKHVIATLQLSNGVEHIISTPKQMPESEVTSPFDWSPDATGVLASCSIQPGIIGICLYSTEANMGQPPPPRVLTSRSNYGLYEAQFSPDGRWVCFNAVNEGRSVVYVAAVGGDEWLPVTQGRFWDDKPRWSPDGHALYFTSLRRGFVNVWAQLFDPERGETVGEAFSVTAFETPARVVLPRIKQLHVALSNKRMILPMSDISASVWVLENVDR